MKGSAPAWHAEARRLIEGGMSVRSAARAVGKSATTVRAALDINGAYSKAIAANKLAKAKARRREREREQYTGVRTRPERRDRAGQNERRSVQAAYADHPEPRGITLPALALGTLGAEEDSRPVARLAPKTRLGSPGADRWREIHRRMIRDGKIPEPGLVEDLHH